MAYRTQEIKSWIGDNKLIVLLGVVSALLVGSAVWSHYTTEYEIETNYNTQARAKFNQLYAVELLLNQKHNQEQNKDADENGQPLTVYSQLDMDLSELVTALSDFKKDEASSNAKMPTLLINSINTGLSEAKYDAIMQWVESGGHLITFNGKYNAVDSSEWQEVTELLKSDAVSTNKTPDTDATSKALDTSSADYLSKALAKINEDYNNNFLKYLNIYKVSSKSISFKDSDEEIEKAKQQLEEILKDMGVEADELDGLDDKSNDDKSNIKDAEFVSNIIKDMPDSEFALLSKANDTDGSNILANNKNEVQNSNAHYLIKAGSSSRFHGDVFYKKYPQAKPYDTYKNPDIVSIRRYLRNQQQLLNQLIKKTSKTTKFDEEQKEKTNDNKKKYFFFEYDAVSKEQAQGILNALLKLDDERLQAIFAPVDTILFDSHFGKGRLTVLTDKSIFQNPDNYDINIAKHYADIQAKPVALLSKQSWGLYDFDNANLLSDLTNQAQAVWLFPKVDIDALPVMLWKKAKLAVLGLLGLIFVWMYSLYNRFGRRQQLTQDADRDIFTYFRQIGRYAWSVDNANQLSAVAQAEVLALIHQNIVMNSQDSQTDAIHKPNNASMRLSNKVIRQLHGDLMRRFNEKIQQIQSTLASLEQNNQLINDYKQDDDSTKFWQKRNFLNNKPVNLSKNGFSKDNQSQYNAIFVDNKEYFAELLSVENLQEAFRDTDEYQVNSAGFVMETQTLWLIKWLLK